MPGSVNLGTVHVGLELQLSKLRSGVLDAKKDLKGLEMSLTKISDVAKNVGRTMSLSITAPLLYLGKQSVDTAVKMDSLKRGIIAVDGAGSDLTKTLKDLDQIAKLPGLGLVEAREGYVNLRAAGIGADMAKRSLMAFGNALATVGKGKADLDGVTLALTQLQNRTSGFGQEVRQLQERLPQIRQMMIQAFGTADSEAIGKSGITGSQFIEAITAQFEKLPKMTSGARNAMENFSDSLTKLKAAIGEAILPQLIKWMDDLSPKIEAATKWFNQLSPAGKDALTNIGVGLAAGGPLMIGLAMFINSLTTIKGLFVGIAGTTAFKYLAGLLATPAGAAAAVTAGAVGLNFLPKNLAKYLPTPGQRAKGADDANVFGETLPKWMQGPSANDALGAFMKAKPKGPAQIGKDFRIKEKADSRAAFGNQYAAESEIDLLRMSGHPFRADVLQARQDAKEAIAQGAKRADAEAVLTARIKEIWKKYYEWREERIDRIVAKETPSYKGSKGKGFPGDLLYNLGEGIELPPMVTKEFAEKLVEDLPAELGKAIQQALDKAHDALITTIDPKTRDVVAHNLIPLEEIAESIKPRVAEFSIDIGREFATNMAAEFGREFSDMFDKIFGSGNPLMRAISRTLGRVVDDLMYAVAQKAIGKNLMISLFGGGGGGMFGGGGGAPGGIDPMTGNPALGAAAGAKAAGLTAGQAWAAGFYVAAFVGVGKALQSIFKGTPQGKANLKAAFANTPGFQSAAMMPGIGGAGMNYINVNFHGSNFNNNQDPGRVADALAWHVDQKMRSRPGSG